jgi:hypothetical protein
VVPAKHTRADDGDSNFIQNLTYHGIIQATYGDHLFESAAIEGFRAKG